MRIPKSVLQIAALTMLCAVSPLLPVYSQSIPGEIPGQTYFAVVPKTITLDGDFSDWAGVPQSTFADGTQPSPNAGTDGAVTFAVAADTANLYFSASVADSNIIAGQHGIDYWNEDSLEIYINASGNLGLTSYAPGVAQITFSPVSIGLPAEQAVIGGINSQGMGVRATVVKTAGGYAIEAAVPLVTSNWNITPTNGSVIGFDVQLNGAMQLDRDIKLSWSNVSKTQDLAYQNPSVFGQLSFYQPDAAPAAPVLEPTLFVPTPTLLMPEAAPTLAMPTLLPPTLVPATAVPTMIPPTPEIVIPINGEALPIPGEAPGQTYFAAFPKTISLDGNFSDWAGLPQVRVVDGPQPAVDPGVDGAMTFAVSADATSLYFAAAVTDSNIIANQHGVDYWNEDSVEIYLNTTADLALTTYTTGVTQITIPAANIGLSAEQAIIEGQNAQGMGIRAVVIKTAGGYAMEVAIPLVTSNWNITPTNGSVIGFDVQLNGATQMNRDIKLSWSRNNKTQDQAYQDPSVFGQLSFYQLGGTVPTLIPPAAPTSNAPVFVPTTEPPVAPTLAPTLAPTAGSAAGAFSVQGSTIIAPDGSPFVARGVNVNGSNWVWQRSTVGDVQSIVDCWNFNLIRVNSFLFTGEQPWGQYSDNNDLDSIVQAYTARGVVVLFEAHDRIGRYYDGSELTTLVNWFTELATRYRDNPYVWFDVMNEPGGRGALDVERWVNVHQQVIRAIRDTAGANNIIMVEGATGGQDAGSSGSGLVGQNDSAILQYAPNLMSFGGKTYPNIVFSIHPYDLWNAGDAKMADFFDRVRASNLALIVGEYGVLTDQDTTSAASSVINTAPPRGVGRIVWHWDGHDYNDLTRNTFWGGGWEIDHCTSPTNLSWLGLAVWIDNHTP